MRAVVEILVPPPKGDLGRGVPEMCKWNAFTIDRKRGVCKDGASHRENIFHWQEIMENHEHPSPDTLGRKQSCRS
jgi:hypothetical protein